MYLIRNHNGEFTPIEVSREIGVTNKTVINRLTALVKCGFVTPVPARERIRSYELSELTKANTRAIKRGIR